jgi:CHAT domain-containing protein/tetratricopeptide (TPR) repeat protein
MLALHALVALALVQDAPPVRAPSPTSRPPSPAPQRRDELPPLEVGKSLEGEVTDKDPIVHTPTLDKGYTDGPVRGTSYQLQVKEPGPVTIELRSYFFDAYLVVRDAKGELVAEDDDGLLRSHSRVVLDVKDGGTSFTVKACALHGGVGGFALRAVAGNPVVVTGVERTRLEIEDARAALRVVEAARGPDDPATATSLSNLAGLLDDGGSFEEARPLFERALAIDEKALGPEHLETATDLNNLALLYEHEGRLELARPLLERALAIHEKTVGPEDPLTATNLNNLGLLLEQEGDYEGARHRFERSLAVDEKAYGPEHPSTALDLSNLAVVLERERKLDEARATGQRALAIRQKVLGPEHPDTLRSVEILAAIFHGLGRLDEARSLHERALAIQERVLGPEHPDVATTLHNVAALFESQRDYAEAAAHYRRALAIREKVLGPEHPDSLTTLSKLAGTQMLSGDLDGARRSFERVLALREKALGPEHPDTASTRNNLALTLEFQGQCRRALPLFEQATATWQRLFGLANPNTVRGLQNLAGCLFDLRDDEGARQVVSKALQGVRAYTFARIAPTSDSDVVLAMHQLQDVTEQWISAVDRSRRGDDDVYAAVLEEKGRSFQLSQTRRNALSTNTDPRLEPVVGRLQTVRAAMSNLFSRRDAADHGPEEQELAQLRTERDGLETELAKAVDTSAGLPRATPDAVRRALPKECALLDFVEHRSYERAEWRGDEVVKPGAWGEPRLSVWISCAASDTTSWVDLGPSAPIESAVAALLEAVDGEAAARGAGAVSAAAPEGSAATSKRRAQARQVRRLVWDPLLPRLAGATRIVVVADGPIATLPFGILEKEDGKAELEERSFQQVEDPARLVAGHPAETRPDAPNADALTSVGGVDYDEACAAVPDATRVVADLRGPFVSNWPALANTGVEADAVAAIHARRFPKSERTSLHGRDASEERVKAALGRSRYVHLATHGYFDVAGLVSITDSVRGRRERAQLHGDERGLVAGYWPQFLCGVVCAGANHPPPGRDDGLLTGDEVSGLDLSSCDLVVLSACRTAVGRRQAYEGVQSLTRSFRLAGARTVVSSLWQVRDDSTKDLMLDFYDRLWNKNESKLDALRDAQIDMLKKNREKYGDTLPATWGAFVLTGDPE